MSSLGHRRGGRAYFGKEETRERRFKIALMAPIVFLLTFAVSFFLQNLLLTSCTGSDIGIGDHFEVPIKHGYRLFIVNDMFGSIAHDRNEFVSIEKICLDGDVVYGKNHLGCFVLNTATGELTKETDCLDDSRLEDVMDFYQKRYWQVNGIGIVLILLLSIALASFVVVKLAMRIK